MLLAIERWHMLLYSICSIVSLSVIVKIAMLSWQVNDPPREDQVETVVKSVSVVDERSYTCDVFEIFGIMFNVFQSLPCYFVSVIPVHQTTQVGLFPFSVDPIVVSALSWNVDPMVNWALFVVVTIVWSISSVIISVVLETRSTPIWCVNLLHKTPESKPVLNKSNNFGL